MNPDVFYYCFTIEQPGKILLVLMVVCLLGSIITLWAMLTVSKFFLDKDNNRFTIMRFQFPWSHAKLDALIKNIPENRKDAVRMQLKIDYYLMPFIYGLLFFAGCYVLWTGRQSAQVNTAYYHLLWIPVLAWLCDIAENKLTFSSLNKPLKNKTRLLLGFSLLKWVLAVLFFLFVIVKYIAWCF